MTDAVWDSSRHDPKGSRSHRSAGGSSPSDLSNVRHRPFDHDYHHDRERIWRAGRDLTFKVPALPSHLVDVQRAFESAQTELLVQSRRKDDIQARIARTEDDVIHLSKLAAETEDLYAEDRQQKHSLLGTLTRRTEEALVLCRVVEEGQDRMASKLDQIEYRMEAAKHSAEGSTLAKEVSDLRLAVRNRFEIDVNHAVRRVEALSQLFEQNSKLPQEVSDLRRVDGRHDLELAGLWGQLEAVTALVRARVPADVPATPWPLSPVPSPVQAEG